LSTSLGGIGQFDQPELQRFLAEFRLRVKKAGKPSGMTFTDLEKCRRSYGQRYRFINIGTLVHYGIVGLKAALAQLCGEEREV
jgi:2-keto-3-deoxy-L-rhamnonate aldolase RhmA